MVATSTRNVVTSKICFCCSNWVLKHYGSATEEQRNRMPCGNKMRNMLLLFSATQQNFCFISLCGILRTPENSLFPLNGTGVDGREVGRGIRREGKSVTLETAPKEGGQRDRMQRLCGPPGSSTSFSHSGPSMPLCPSLVRRIKFNPVALTAHNPVVGAR